MKAKEWLDCDSCPGNTAVWIANQNINGKGRISIDVGYKSSYDGTWRFDSDDRVGDYGHEVLGWYPINIPTYEVEE